MFSFLAYIYIGVTKCVKISLMTKTENTVVKHGLTQTQEMYCKNQVILRSRCLLNPPL